MIRSQTGFAIALALVSGCARIPVEQAEDQCARVVQTGGYSSSSVTIGVGGGFGNSGGAGIALSTAIPQYRDPDRVFADCVRRKSGVPPRTAFILPAEPKG